MTTATRVWAVGLAVSLLSAALAEPARAQRMPRSGVVLGVHLNATALWASRDGRSLADADVGLGGGFRIGFAPLHFATVFASFDGARLPLRGEEGRNQFRHSDLGVRLHLRPVGLTPWLELTRSARRGVVETGTTQGLAEVWGRGLGAGIGLAAPMTTALALEVGLHITRGDFDELEVLPPDDRFRYGATSLRFRVGLNWWPTVARRASETHGGSLPER